MSPAELSAVITAVVRDAIMVGQLTVSPPSEVTVERPRHKAHGDYATNIALQLSRAAGRAPREIAELLAERMRSVPGISDVDVAGPGFINVRLAESALGALVRTILADAAGYGRSEAGRGERVNLEFVSANPTGPVTLASTRWAAVGDALARLLRAAGHAVATEYYVNDTGVQVERFGESLDAVSRGLPVPADGYAGGYIAEVARQVVADNPGLLEQPTEKSREVFAEQGLRLMLAEIGRSLREFGVEFDTWFSERSLHVTGALEAAVDRLRTREQVFEADGAVWLRTTAFGDDKDRPLVKSDGQPTYFCADAAYYLDKRTRGFDRCLYLLGADHHGYVPRLRAMVACFGDDPDAALEVLIGQMVHLTRSGEPVRMSKRAGTFRTLGDLVEAVGVDAARYSLVRASTDSTLELDLDLISRQTSDNPVLYVQYVPARISSILPNAAELGVEPPADPDSIEVSLLSHERESDLLLALGEFPRVVASAAELRDPHRVARYLEHDVAPAFHRFYDACQVLPRGDEAVTPLTIARLGLCQATRVVVANALRLLGVSAPERM